MKPKSFCCFPRKFAVLAFSALVALISFLIPYQSHARKIRGDNVRSLWLTNGPVTVWQKPRFGSPIRGAMEKTGRFRVKRVLSPGGGCIHRWFQLGPEAFVCSGWIKGSKKPPTKRTDLSQKHMAGQWVINRKRRTLFYPRLRALSQGKPKVLKVLAGFRVTHNRLFGKRAYLRTAEKGWVSHKAVQPAPTTNLVGVKITKKNQLPLAFVMKKTRVFAIKRGTAVPTARALFPYDTWRVIKKISAKNGCYLQITKNRFLSCQDVRFAPAPPKPPKVLRPNEKWIDMDGPNHILYARQGQKVLRVSLVTLSSNTPGGVFRVEHKHVNMTLYNQHHKSPWYLEKVPYVVFFHEGFALHGAYWHNSFGSNASHGCVNMSPADAKWIFDFTIPCLPRGFSRIDATAKDPGTLIRIRGQRKKVRTPWSRRRPKKPSAHQL